MSLPRIGSKASLADRAYDALKEAIIRKVLMPDQLLNEEQLAHELGISRTPLREALQRLQYEHLLRPLPGRGYQIASLNREDMEQVFFMRNLLEPPSAAEAARRATPDDAQALQDLVILQEQAVAAGDYLKYLYHDRDFHLMIASMCDNPYLHSAIGTMQFHGHRFLVLDETVRQRAQGSLPEHGAIAAAIGTGDAARAADLMLEHIAKTYTMLAAVLPPGGRAG